jgi:hypothetical protein
MIALCIQGFSSKETAMNIDCFTMYVAVYTGDQLEATKVVSRFMHYEETGYDRLATRPEVGKWRKL